MKLSIEGAVSTYHENLIRELVGFVLNDLIDKRKLVHMEVTIVLTDEVHQLDQLGSLATLDEPTTKTTPRKFLMRISEWIYKDKDELLIQLRTVTHECRHIAQYRNGDLRYCPINDEYHWKGEVFDGDVRYTRRPWELEAHGAEKLMTEEFCEDYGYDDEPWFYR